MCIRDRVMDIGTNYYRDYLDFAQNKGAFTPQDTPLEFAQRNGDKFTFDKIPNSGARNNKGNFTSLGRNFVVTANHKMCIRDRSVANKRYKLPKRRGAKGGAIKYK